MKRFISTIAAITLLGGVTLAANSQSHTNHHAGKTASARSKRAAIVCPVTGDKIASAHKAVGHSVYKSKTYFFCCAGCKPRFDRSPAKFVKNAAKGRYEKM
jgi:YHS domain-containing protein